MEGIEFVELWALPSAKHILAYQVVSLEDPYHPMDVGYATTRAKAVEMAEAYEEERDTMMYGGRGMKIYEIAILQG